MHLEVWCVYSDLTFFVTIIAGSCTQHLLRALSTRHTKTMKEGWGKKCCNVVLKLKCWGFVDF